MYQNVKWLRFILFAIGCMGMAVVVPAMGMPHFASLIVVPIVLFRRQLQRWFGFRKQSEILTDPQQIASAREQEKVADIMMIVFACMLVASSIVPFLPHEPLFSIPL
ncbi:MAG: hypothetical protein AAGF95_24865 [Chloroflexota bacterium]